MEYFTLCCFPTIFFSHISSRFHTHNKREGKWKIVAKVFAFIAFKSFQRRKSSDEHKSSDFHATAFETKLNNKSSSYVHKLIRDGESLERREKKSWEKEGKSAKIFRSSHKNSEKKTLEMWKEIWANSVEFLIVSNLAIGQKRNCILFNIYWRCHFILRSINRSSSDISLELFFMEIALR